MLYTQSNLNLLNTAQFASGAAQSVLESGGYGTLM